MTTAGLKDDAAKMRAWSNDWLSVLGLNKGITGLVKDFVGGYLGRSDYHDSNGPFIDSIKSVSSAYPQKGADFDEKAAAALSKTVIDVCDKGTKLFSVDGSMYQMLDELRSLLKSEGSAKYFAEGLRTNSDVKKAFEYLAGNTPDDSDDDEEL